MKFVYTSTAQLASVLLLTQQHTPTFVHGVPSGTYHISTAEHEDYEDPAVSITNCFHLQELNSRNELSTAVFQLFQLHCILLIGSSSTHTNIIAILNTDIFPSSLLITQATLNGNPAPRTSTATDSFTADIVLSGSTADRSALRANGKDQQEEEQKGYLSTLMSSFGIPSLHDGRNEGGILPSSDEVLSVADEKDGHAVRLFISIKKYLFLFRSSNIFSFSFQHDNCMYFH